jgi:hypothetical protein
MDIKVATAYTHMILMVDSTSHINGATGKVPSLAIKLSKNAAAGVPMNGTPLVEVDATNLPGVYALPFTAIDTNTLGSFAIAATATGCDPTNEVHRVVTQLPTDFSLGASGRANVTSNLIQGQPFTALFFMTLSGTNNPAPGLTITGQRTFGAAGFSNISGTIQEVGFPAVGTGGGWYVLNGAAADSASATAGFKMSATGANDSDFTLWMQP